MLALLVGIILLVLANTVLMPYVLYLICLIAGVVLIVYGLYILFRALTALPPGTPGGEPVTRRRRIWY